MSEPVSSATVLAGGLIAMAGPKQPEPTMVWYSGAFCRLGIYASPRKHRTHQAGRLFITSFIVGVLGRRGFIVLSFAALTHYETTGCNGRSDISAMCIKLLNSRSNSLFSILSVSGEGDQMVANDLLQF